MNDLWKGVATLEELKKRYKELSKLNHPDLGGCVEVMKMINLEYESLSERFMTSAGMSYTE